MWRSALPYLENLLTLLNIPLFYVPGNHDPIYNPESSLAHVEGGSNLDLKLVRFKKFLIGGLGGSILYRPNGTNQYSQTEAYLRAFRLLPRLLLNRLNYGSALDILITHSPPFGIHDEDTQSHQGSEGDQLAPACGKAALSFSRPYSFSAAKSFAF